MVLTKDYFYCFLQSHDEQIKYQGKANWKSFYFERRLANCYLQIHLENNVQSVIIFLWQWVVTALTTKIVNLHLVVRNIHCIDLIQDEKYWQNTVSSLTFKFQGRWWEGLKVNKTFGAPIDNF